MFNEPYPALVEQMKRKFSNYTYGQCLYAIRDCHETLKVNPHDPLYTRKLWAEIDAARDRIMELDKAAQVKK